MQTLTFQQSIAFTQAAMINRSQVKEPSHVDIRDAVRAWAAVAGQDVVAAHIVDQWRSCGGEGIEFPADISRARQKLFRWLDNRFDTEDCRERVRQLTPSILVVLPLEHRGSLVGGDCKLTRLAHAEKEVAEAKRAVLLDAPRHQKLKEVSEGIAALFRLEPDLAGPLMAMVTTMLGGI
ncbi:toxin YdaT domain-containing protein [Enterobacter sp. DE0047]|uniref:toxin YdaT domain-containing protein n=1 Tax=Enterobacter sp. DE0047 TaxID=2584949 RepID=UPI0011A6F222|nr:toxin YdaT domain-containing protein [Enterobacter sp. DE0047]